MAGGTDIATVYVPILICYTPSPTAAAPKRYFQLARSVAAACEGVLHKASLTLASSSWTAALCVKNGETERRYEDGTRVIEQTYKVIACK